MGKQDSHRIILETKDRKTARTLLADGQVNFLNVQFHKRINVKI